MSDFDAGRCLPLLLDVAVKSLIVSAAALAALPLLRRASAAVRHLVLLAALGVLLGLPTLMLLLPRQTLPHSPRAEPLGFNEATPRLRGHQRSGNRDAYGIAPAQAGAGTTGALGFSPEDGATAPAAALPALPLPPAATPAPASPLPVRPAWLVFGWLGGVLACTGRFLAAQARVWRLTRRCPPLPPSLLSEPEAGAFAARKAGPAGTPPMVWGWPRPALLLPPEAAAWPAARLRAVLRHEAAHVRRGDWLTQTLAQAACALYWFNPLVWLLAARMNAEAERACDDAVLLSGVPPTDYAQDLLAVARQLGAGRPASPAAVAMARRSPVRGRLESILDTRRPRRHLTRRAAALCVCVAVAVAAPLAALRPAARADAPPTGVPTEADIARVQQHLQGLEQARAVYDYASAQPNMLTPAQTALVDKLIQQRERQRGYERFGPQGEADYTRLQAEAKKPHTREERKRIWWAIFAYEHRPANVVKRQHDFNVSLARLQSGVDTLPAAQVARETKMYGFDRAVALDKTQMERMQMERDLGYPLHMYSDDLADTARWGLESEKSGEMTRADRVHLFLLNAKAMQGKPLSDADLDSALVILRAPSTHPGEAHAYVIALLLDMRTTVASQQQKIRDAITPLLTSSDRLGRTYSKAVFRRYSGSVPAPLPQKARTAPAAASPAHPRPAPQADQTGVPAMTSIKSMKAALLKTAAFATLAAGLTSPAAQAQPVAPAPAPRSAAPKPAAPTPPAPDALHWNEIVLHHANLATILANTHWGQGGALPEGVKRVFFLNGNQAILLQATPDGLARAEGMVKPLDIAPQIVQIRVTFATVTAADLNASIPHLDLIPLDSPEEAAKTPPMSIQGADGSAVAAYLAALVARKATLAAPTVTTRPNTPSTIIIAGVSLVPGWKSVPLTITPRLSSAGVLTLQLAPPLAHGMNPDETPGPGTPTPQALRVVRSGTTLLLVNPLLKTAGTSDHCLLIFVTPTVLPDHNSATAG